MSGRGEGKGKGKGQAKAKTEPEPPHHYEGWTEMLLGILGYRIEEGIKFLPFHFA